MEEDEDEGPSAVVSKRRVSNSFRQMETIWQKLVSTFLLMLKNRNSRSLKNLCDNQKFWELKLWFINFDNSKWYCCTVNSLGVIVISSAFFPISHNVGKVGSLIGLHAGVKSTSTTIKCFFISIFLTCLFHMFFWKFFFTNYFRIDRTLFVRKF